MCRAMPRFLQHYGATRYYRRVECIAAGRLIRYTACWHRMSFGLLAPFSPRDGLRCTACLGPLLHCAERTAPMSEQNTGDSVSAAVPLEYGGELRVDAEGVHVRE